MACKLPAIVPKYSAMQDWCNGGVYYVDVRPEPWRNPQNIDTRHAFIDVDSAVEALETLYQNKALRDEYAEKGYKLATDKKYNWRAIGSQFLTICKNATRVRSIEIPEVWKK